jgi:hypothetical protein
MNKTTTTVMLIAGFVLVGARMATAQGTAPAEPTKAFVDVNIGVQTPSRTLETSTSFPLYNENAVVNSAQTISSGAIFDARGGYRLGSRFGVAVAVSVLNRSSAGSLTASIPDPYVFNNPKIVTATGTGLTHNEIGTHVQLVWFVPVTEQFEVNIYAGPSFIYLTQDIMTASVPAGTQDVTVATQQETGTAIGGNVGVDGNYLFNRRYGVGIFVRYAGGSVDLPSASGAQVGGFQVGGGLRVRF